MSKIDITPSEMMELRNQGYSNKDIANMLDISHETVRKYIGKQGKRMGRQAAFVDKSKKPIVASVEPATPPYAPKAVTEEYMLGEVDTESVMFVKLKHDTRKIVLNTFGGEIALTYEQARELVQFLAWASRERITEEENDKD